MNLQETKLILDNLSNSFYNLFTNKDGTKANVEAIYGLCIKECLIIKNSGTTPEIYSLPQFIEPRIKILTDGTLVEFEEKEIEEQTKIFGNIAQRFSTYKKSGILSGQKFTTRGMKTMQFLKTPEGWKISSVAWDDEKDGLVIQE